MSLFAFLVSIGGNFCIPKVVENITEGFCITIYEIPILIGVQCKVAR